MNHTSPQHNTFAALLMPENVLCHVSSNSPEEVLHLLLDTLTRNGDIADPEAAYQALHARLGEPGVYVGHGVALPHARMAGLPKLVVALATAPSGIAFGGPEPARLIVLVLTPKDAPALYLETLSSLSRICADEAAVDTILASETPEAIIRVFQGGAAESADFIRAGDIMEVAPVTLLDTDPLAKAIDLFTRNNLMNVPVVDRDGELVGVVTAYELLKVCLPDYILWMDDVSPIINFEPFAEVLRHETDTWLAEIMSETYAVVSSDAPAIEVAKEITKHKTRDAFVVEGKRLVGIIRLQRFLNMVFRE